VAESAHLSFISSLRRGLAVAIEPIPETPPGAARPSTRIDVTLEFDTDVATAPLTLVGPGDIVGLDPRAVVRTFPRADDNDAQVGFFAMIEFDQPDLPWRYTPTAATEADVTASTDKLKPWFNLILLEEGTELTEDQILPAGANRKLPLLNTKSKHLPDLSESWAFAHTQVKGAPPPEGFSGKFLTQPGVSLARLLAPRALKVRTAYRALLVPTFKRGLQVGGGEKPTADLLELAWQSGTAHEEDDVVLPVYYQWRFQTGTTGTFEDLAMALQPRPNLGPQIGARQLDVSDPGLDLAAPSTLPLDMGGALQSLEAKALPLPTLSQEWLNDLKVFLDDPSLEFEDAKVRLVVAPPMYGRWYAKIERLDGPPPAPPPPEPRTNPPWFYTLNTDPRHRAAAALGTEVVQRDQEALMESAWEQARSLALINRQRTIMQLGRELWKSLIGRHLKMGLLENMLTATAQVHSRVKRGTTTIFAQVRSSALGEGFFEPIWRRLTSPQAAIGRRLKLHLLPPATPLQLFDRMNEGELRIAPPPGIPKRLPTTLDVFDPLIPGGLEDGQVGPFADRLGKDALNFWGQVLFWAGRQALTAENGKFFWLAHKLIRFGMSLIRLAADPQRKLETFREKLRNDTITGQEILNGPKAPGFVAVDEVPDLAGAGPIPVPAVPDSGPDSQDAGFYRQALADLFDHWRVLPEVAPPFQVVDLNGIKNDLFSAIDPEKTFVAASKFRHIIVDKPSFPWESVDPLEPYQAAPTFEQPMYLPLKELSPEWILPGVGKLERNTVGAVVSNQAFIEAYMVGLNHEMTRELLWREYPIDQRGTYFRQFWDARGWVKGNTRATPDLHDIKEVRAWGNTNLGQNTARTGLPADDFLVLLVRGDLIKRYPNVIVYAARARDPNLPPPRTPDDSDQEHPILHGFLGDDVAFYGFALSPRQVRGNDGTFGWYVVFQEQPAEPRFDIPGASGEGKVLVQHFTIPGPPNQPPVFVPTAAGMIAAEWFADPRRLAIHGHEFVPETT
jgi:hypothetical protein